jgi:DNA-binding GntR family transcriptional regulator
LRSVLQQLSHEGLLETKNGVGTIVTDINMKTFKDIYALRMLLAEAMGSQSPKPVSSEHIEALSELIERAEALKSKKDVEEYARIANSLEELLIDLIGSDPLREITDILYYRVSRIWFTFLPNLVWDEVINSLLNEINRMRDAMRQNDVQAIGEIRKFHLGGILEKISAYIIN